jgi:hypothetical protein
VDNRGLVMFTEEEKNKLPKWAQSKILKLESDLAECEKELLIALGTHPPSNIYINRYGIGSNIYLNNHDNITFDDGKEIQMVTCGLNVHHKGYVRIDSGLSSGLIIKPLAANCILVR